jgi:hypothetical protein
MASMSPSSPMCSMTEIDQMELNRSVSGFIADTGATSTWRSIPHRFAIRSVTAASTRSGFNIRTEFGRILDAT